MKLDPLFIWVVSFGMTMMFLAAGWHKLASLSRFKVIVAEYDVLPKPLAGPVACSIPLVEFSLALLWLTQLAPMFAAGISIALLSMYCLAMGINLRRGRVHISCGCGFTGSTVTEQPLSYWLIVRNVVLILMLSVCLLPQAEREFLWVDIVAVLFASCTGLILYSSVSQLLKNDGSMASWRSPW